MRGDKQNRFNFLLLRNAWAHLLFWISLVLVINIIFQFDITRDVLIQGKAVTFTFEVKIIRVLLLGLVFKMLLFYVNLFWLAKFSDGKSLSLNYYLVLSLTTIVLFVSEQLVIDLYYRVFKRITNGSIRSYLIRVNVLIYLTIIGASLVYHFINERVNIIRKQAILRTENLNTQLQLLSHKMNPHFLFDTMNNFYGLAEENNNPELADGIYRLSALMRYTLYDSTLQYIELEKEIAYLKDYIHIYRLRLDKEDKVDIQLVNEVYTKNIQIAPMTLVPLVENALKHGVNLNHNSYIHIHIKEDNEQIVCKICNTNYALINRTKIKQHSGIGLKNLQKRLDLLYHKTHQFCISDNETEFSVILSLKKVYA